MDCKNFVILLLASIYIRLFTTHDVWRGYFGDATNTYSMGTDFTTATYILQGLSNMLGRHQVGSSSSRFSCGYASAEDTGHYG